MIVIVIVRVICIGNERDVNLKRAEHKIKIALKLDFGKQCHKLLKSDKNMRHIIFYYIYTLSCSINCCYCQGEI